MLEDCEAGEIDIICTKSISRFARNTVECIKIVRELQKKQIDVYFEKENIHTLSAEKSEFLISFIPLWHRRNRKAFHQTRNGAYQKDL